MAGNPSVKKRQKEMERRNRQKEKELKRHEKRSERQNRDPALANGEDPDIAGIIPGPQPVEEAEADVVS